VPDIDGANGINAVKSTAIEPMESEVIIVGGGLAGVSAAIHLGRAKRRTLLIDSGKSMARWEPEVANYLGFPDGIDGKELLHRGRVQSRQYGVTFARDEIVSAATAGKKFRLEGRCGRYQCQRLLLATGIFHIPPDIPGVKPCLGHSLFFCKDCDGTRVEGQDVAIYGNNDEAVEYALGMLLYSPCVTIVTDGHEPRWDRQHSDWLQEYAIPLYFRKIVGVMRDDARIEALEFEDGSQLFIRALFTTRGDIYFNQLARSLGARVNADGEIVINENLQTSVPGLYAAGCVTPANCQMIIAAGQGAAAAQAINRDLFEESLATHSLRRFRTDQLRRKRTRPRIRVTAVMKGKALVKR